MPRRGSDTRSRRTSNILQEIIERHRATTDERLLATELQRNLATQEYGLRHAISRRDLPEDLQRPLDGSSDGRSGVHGRDDSCYLKVTSNCEPESSRLSSGEIFRKS